MLKAKVRPANVISKSHGPDYLLLHKDPNIVIKSRIKSLEKTKPKVKKPLYKNYFK